MSMTPLAPRAAATDPHPDATHPAEDAPPPVQLALALDEAAPVDRPDPAAPSLADDRQHAIASSQRLLDALADRARTQAGVREDDRAASLAGVAEQRRRLDRAARRD